MPQTRPPAMTAAPFISEVVYDERQANHHNRLVRAAVIGDRFECRQRTSEQRIAAEKVTARVAGQSEFRQYDQVRVAGLDHGDRRLGIRGGVRDRQLGAAAVTAKDAVREQRRVFYMEMEW